MHLSMSNLRRGEGGPADRGRAFHLIFKPHQYVSCLERGFNPSFAPGRAFDGNFFKKFGVSLLGPVVLHETRA